jgi:NAD(P)H-dependent FMN reductase
MSCLVFSSIHSKTSKVDQLALKIHETLSAHNINSKHINIGQLDLPICDGYSCYSDPKVKALQEEANNASGFIFCSPVYCYDVNAICKNLIELCGQSFKDKPAGIAVVAGGSKSYMAPLSFMNSLMLDFRSLIIPRFIYATGEDFDSNNQVSSPDILKRINQLVAVYSKLASLGKL